MEIIQRTVLKTICTSVPLEPQERDIASRDRNHLDAENRSLRERLDASQSMWSNRKQELEEREARLSHLSKEFKTIEFDSQVAKTELKSFKESLALLLSEGTSNCQPHDDVIKERIKALQIASRENNTVSYTVIHFSSCFIISIKFF